MIKKCSICHKEFLLTQLVAADLISDYISKMIQTTHPDWGHDSLVCIDDLNQFRSQYVRGVLKQDMGELTELENEVLKSLKEHEIIADDLNRQFEQNKTYGERLSDKLPMAPSP